MFCVTQLDHFVDSKKKKKTKTFFFTGLEGKMHHFSSSAGMGPLYMIVVVFLHKLKILIIRVGRIEWLYHGIPCF